MSGTLCAPHPGVFMSESVQFAAHLLPLHSGASHEQRVAHNRRMLLSVLDLETTVAFIGSGVSRPFGYPSWDSFARGVIDFTETALEARGRSEDLASLRPDEGQSLDSTDLMFLIGSCKKILGPSLLGEYHRHLEGLFAPRRERPDLDPLKSLLQLPIQRFATSNYDCEIERALSEKLSIPLSEFGLDNDLKSLRPCPGTCRRSFTQRKESLHQLALLSLAGIADNENMVCHCHGRFDDPESIIATEEDYQRWYLSTQDGASLAYQQAIQLMLGSNPVLFIGYGMRDDDLLRPLRELVSIDREGIGSRPIFALLPAPRKTDDRFHQAALFDRYGLNVVTYEGAAEGADSEQQTKAFCNALDKLHDDWKEAHRRWISKPKLKKAEAHRGGRREHRDIHIETQVQPAPLSEPALSILRPGIVVLQGPSGSGKSCHALNLLSIAAGGTDEVERFDGAFYWNAHYANETITAIEYALSYFDPHGAYKGDPYERIRQCLVRERNLLIIDGCERLLRKGNIPDAGRAYSANLRHLLHVFADRATRSTVILAGRLWPADLDDLQAEQDGVPLIRKIQVERITSRELRAMPPFRDLRPEDVSALSSLLRGHGYGLDLAFHHLTTERPGERLDPGEKLRTLNERLSDRLSDQRLREMMRIVLEDLDVGRRTGITLEFLERIGLFLNPVCERTLLLSYREALKAVSKEDPDPPEDELRRSASALYCALVAKGLLLPVGPEVGAPKCGIEGYTLHSTARRLLFQPDQGQATDSLPALGLSGFTSGRLGVAPDRGRCHQTRELFDDLVLAASRCSREGAPRAALQLCRDAFGLVRTRMEANTAPVWSDYKKYLHFGLRLIPLAKQVSREHWTYCEHWDAREGAEHPDAPLYAAELAWLYNDTALALSGAGHVHEACALWEQTYEISRLLENPRQGGGFHLEILLNLTFNFIETGYLPAAKGHLDNAERLVQGVPDDDYIGRIQGLRGLMEHLAGNLQGACDFYDECLERLRRGNNLRAQSIYLKHKADVKIVMGDCEQANLLIRSSRSLAEAGVFPELVANARISEGHRLFRQREAVRARMEYDAVLRDARRMKAHKLEARALTALARLALDQKDIQRAHDHAIQSLSLANQLGLGLRQTHSLVVLGLITLEEGQQEFGIAYLRHAKRLADNQEYWARSREAEDKLLALDVDPDGTEYPPRSVTGMRK